MGFYLVSAALLPFPLQAHSVRGCPFAKGSLMPNFASNPVILHSTELESPQMVLGNTKLGNLPK